MKGRKICIKLLILCITCLLSLNLSLNVSAKINSSIVRFLSSASWYYNGSTQVTRSPTGGGLLNDIYLQASNGGYSFLSNLKFNLRDSISINKNYSVRFKMFIRSDLMMEASSSVFANCPRGGGHFFIDSCKISNPSYEQVVASVNKYTTSSDFYLNSEVAMYHTIDIEGHFDYTDLTSISEFQTYNSFYIFTNDVTNLQTTSTVNVLLFVSPIEFVTEEQGAEDEVAEKELEDRDNLETQSTSTDNEASTAGQSAANTGTTLFGAFTQLFNALTNVNGASCVLPNMQVYSLNLGQMDLCTYDIPPQIMALVSIGMVFIIVPLGIHLVKRMINLYKEITG